MSRQILNYICFLFLVSLPILAQSDYRITQEFKSRQRSFEIAIEYAKTPDELNRIRKEILEFKNEFRGNKELLNRALYPNNFESSFANIDKKIDYSNKKIEEISLLQTKVVTLESDYSLISEELGKLTREVNTLRNSNNKLMNELRAFKSGYSGSKESIDSLKLLISELKQGISQRDTLIKEIMDNIFATAEHKIESLDDAERKGIQTQIKNTSLIDNITNLVKDNIEFLKASLLTVEDLGVLRNEFSEFEQRWAHFGPKLFSIYSTDIQNKEKLVEIDSLISGWNSALDLSVWNSINEVFKSHNIKLETFVSGNEFESSVVAYIDNVIKNGSADIEQDQNYIFFAEKVWNDIIKVDWLPTLITNKLLAQEQIDIIEQKLSDWKDSSVGSTSIFIYGIIVLLAIFIFITLYLLNKKNKQNRQTEIEDIGTVTDKDLAAFESDAEFIDDEKE